MTTMVPSKDYKHVYWIDLHNDGTLHECAILKKDPLGNIIFIEINNLDTIDRRRLVDILMTRHVDKVELYEIMMQKTLGNGVNALEFFHQLAKIMTPNGKIIDPRIGVIGVKTGQVSAADVQAATSGQSATEK